MEIVSIGSSSSGNSYIIKAGSVNLLLDVGLSAKRITDALNTCDIAPEDVSAVLLTHEHIDHVRSVRAISKKCPNAQFYTSRGTAQGTEAFSYVADERINYVSRGDSFNIGRQATDKCGSDCSDAYSATADTGNDEIEIRCFGLSHDAREPIGYSVIADGQQLTVVTDTGIVTDEIFEEMLTADMLVYEANHEEELLMFGPYPYSVKQRIKSDVGHLSNVSSGEVLASLLEERAVERRGREAEINADAGAKQNREESKLTAPTIMLAHLSENNNTPYQARMTIRDILSQHGFEEGEHYTMTIAAPKEMTRLER